MQPGTCGASLRGRRIDAWLAAVGLAALTPLVRFGLDVRHGLDHLLYQRLADDAFYYFEISRHFPEFNDGIATSGFHPLYGLLVAPLHRLAEPGLAVPASLAWLVAAQALGALALFRLLTALWSRPIAAAGAIAWATSGQLYSLAMTGTESVLAASLVVACFVACVRDAPGASDHPLRAASALGLLAGVTFWARMDSPLILAPAVAWATLARLRRGRRAEGITLLACACAPALVWMAWIAWQTGSPFPTSSAALRVRAGLEGVALVPFHHALHLARTALEACGQFVGSGRWEGLFFRGDALLALGLLGALALARRPDLGEPRGVFRFAALALAGLALWTAWYAFVIGSMRYWYLAQLAILLYGVWLPLVAVLLVGALPRAAARFAAPALALAVALPSGPDGPVFPQEYDKYRSALAANAYFAEHPPEGRIASFNTGIYDYFMHADVLNLDGVVNPDAVAALSTGDLVGYVQRMNVRHLIEDDSRADFPFSILAEDPRIELTKVAELWADYPPYGASHAQRTYLWGVRVRAPEGAPPLR